MDKTKLVTGTLSLLIAVILGAMGAHYLKETLHLPADKLESWKTAVFYQIVHSLGILFTVLLAQQNKLQLKWVFRLFLAGIICFSGSIYLLSLNALWEIESLKMILGPITPLGGLLFITGWLTLTINIWKK